MKIYTLKNHTRLFNGQSYLHGTLPWRIIWGGHDGGRVIFREKILNYESGWLKTFPHGCTLDLFAGECANPSNRDEGVWLLRFIDCKPQRSWIPNAGALSSNEVSFLTFWLEVYCQIHKIFKEFEVFL